MRATGQTAPASYGQGETWHPPREARAHHINKQRVPGGINRPSGTGQRAIPLLRRASIALRVAQRRRRVRPNSDLVTNRLTIRVNLVTNLSDLTRRNIGTDELVTIHHVENERLTAARVRRNNHQRTISVNLRAVIQLDSLSLRLNQSERVSQVRLSDN